jgi:predicted metalloprotease with PDZ domain
VFESNEHGTRIMFTQAGFGGPTRFQTEPVHNGMNETLDDLILYLEHGVAFPRHRDVRARCGLGAEFARVPGGLGITEVHPGRFAAEAGVEPGDILLQLGHGPVFDHPDIAFFVRDHETGDEVEVVYARAGEVHRRRARLSPVESPRWTLAG